MREVHVPRILKGLCTQGSILHRKTSRSCYLFVPVIAAPHKIASLLGVPAYAGAVNRGRVLTEAAADRTSSMSSFGAYR